ncbi:MAG: acetyl-CoA carboxylase biotin carboxyl carrier protein [Cyanobacteria bacterium HKST-UBA04]|nr:acetyl-CoA carboxylase biotin carboxyl carrier protein [Cyanobacteria bacterium HKST-UBA04]MCA9841123.1 acetyl-CoA carboxylase biotin carboxyl carrier protein [Cyanobacteria bacterium HKST-UBA03]
MTIKINIEYIESLIELANRHDLAELEVQSDDKKVAIKTALGSAAQTVATFTPAFPAMASAAGLSEDGSAQADSAAGSKDEAKSSKAEAASSPYYQVTSPMVGTFYRSPSPNADAFVEEGQRVSQGHPLCIIEAMKLMNELESDVSGTIKKIYADNGQPVEVGQVLFDIET